MACDDLPDDLQNLWKEAGTDLPVFQPDQLREEMEKLLAKRRRSSLALIVALASVAAGYAAGFFLFRNGLARVGAVVAVAVCGYWIVHALVERARRAPDPGETGGVRFYRAELVHARDNHRWMMWRWLLLPLPFVLFDFGAAQEFANEVSWIVRLAWLDSVLLLAAFAVWAPLKQFRMVRRYQERIDRLDRAARQ